MPSRRTILRAGLRAGLGFPILAGGFFSEQPARASRLVADRLRIGAIGVGNRGANNIYAVESETIAALCDVDAQYLGQMGQRHRSAATYQDFREMLAHPDLDAVLVSTPDHTHFAAASAALERGLHVYCEKPLGHSVGQLFRLTELAAKAKVVTQTGMQHHASDGYRRAAETLQRRVLGEIREVHGWTSKPLWPQGRLSPEPQEPPPHLDWNLWLGPAPERPYAAAYHPFQWRGWWDFGGGALADMGPHLLDPVWWGLELDQSLPVTTPRAAEEPMRSQGDAKVEGSTERAEFEVRAEAGPMSPGTAPLWSIVRWTVPSPHAPDGKLRLVWYDGGKQPPSEVTGGRKVPPNGVLVVGERGLLFIPQLGGNPILMPDRGSTLQHPEPFLPRVPDHHQQWIDACKGRATTGCSFEYAAAVTLPCLLGNVALRAGRPLRFDLARRRFPDDAASNQWLEPIGQRKNW